MTITIYRMIPIINNEVIVDGVKMDATTAQTNLSGSNIKRITVGNNEQSWLELPGANTDEWYSVDVASTIINGP